MTFQSHDHVAVELDNIDFMGLETVWENVDFHDDRKIGFRCWHHEPIKLRECLASWSKVVVDSVGENGLVIQAERNAVSIFQY